MDDDVMARVTAAVLRGLAGERTAARQEREASGPRSSGAAATTSTAA